MEFFDHITDKYAAFIRKQPVFFVATVAGEGDGDVLAGEARDDARGKRRRVAERAVVDVDERLDELESLGLHDELGVLGAELARGHPREAGLVVGGVALEADGEGLHPPGGVLRHQADDHRRVDAAG